MSETNTTHSVSEYTGQCQYPPRFYRQWMMAGNPSLFFDHLSRRHGDFLYYRGLLNFYLVNHPALVRQVLRDTNKTFDKRSVIYARFKNVHGDGLVVSEGERWQRQRKMMQPIFNPVAVKRFFDMMLDSSEKLASQWETHCEAGTVFDAAVDMNKTALEIAGRALLSTGFESTADKIDHWTDVLNRYSAKAPLPIIRDLWFPSRRNREFKQALREFHIFIREMIAERRDTEMKDDLLSILLQVRDEETGQGMSESELVDEVLGMIVGGHETASSALSWLWYELTQHPDIQTRLHQELDEVLGDGPITGDALAKLHYTRQIIDETMRLHPPFWFENRNVAEDCELGGVQLKKGDIVIFTRYALHRNPDFWDQPEVFNPDRFDKDKLENSKSSYAYVPFGGGPRICVGVYFATMEMLCVVATLARKFHVVLDESDRHEMCAHLTMCPRYGVRLRLKKRGV